MKHAALAVMMMACALAAYAGGGGETPPDVMRAERTVDETRAAVPDGLVDISTIAGSVVVRGWNRAEVKVTGTLERDVVALDFGKDGTTTTIDVRGPEPGDRIRNVKLGSTLEISVPAGASVRVSTLGATVEIVGVAGVKDLRTVGGSITVKGGAGPVMASTLGGTITVEAPSTRVGFSTAAGEVVITGADGEIAGHTMSGGIRISGSRIVDGDLSSLSGSITIDAEIAKSGRLKAVAELGGRIDLAVPADTEGRFSLGCRLDAVDMNAFKPRGKIEWVFRERAAAGTLAFSVLGAREGRAEEAIARAFEADRTTPRGIVTELPIGRLPLSVSLNEFTVGADGARIYLETSPMARGKSEGPSIVLKTR
jgi:hypothetical protein